MEIGKAIYKFSSLTFCLPRFDFGVWTYLDNDFIQIVQVTA